MRIVLNIGRLLVLALTSIASFIVGLWASNFADWEKFLGPLAISISALFATTLAVRNIEQGRHQELVRRTLDILDKKPELNNDLTNFRNRINHRINSQKLYEKPITEEVLSPVILSLKSGETNIARVWLKYITHIYIGIQEGIYDPYTIKKNIGTLPINVWRDFWPIAKYQEIKMSQINQGHEFGEELEYWAVEAWVKELSKGKDITREKPLFSYKPLDEDENS